MHAKSSRASRGPRPQAVARPHYLYVRSSASSYACSFSDCRFTDSRLSSSSFRQCQWQNLNFDGGQWQQLQVLDCSGDNIVANELRGEQVDFTGSHFEQLNFNNARINS